MKWGKRAFVLFTNKTYGEIAEGKARRGLSYNGTRRGEGNALARLLGKAFGLITFKK